MSLEDALMAIERSHFKNMPKSEKQALALHIRQSPDRIGMLDIENVEQDTSTRLRRLTRALQQAQQAYERAWNPGNPQQWYTSEERSRLRLLSLQDIIFGGERRATYQEKLTPLVTSRYRDATLSMLDTAQDELQYLCDTVNIAYDRQEASLLQARQRIISLGYNLELSETRLEELDKERKNPDNPGELRKSIHEHQRCQRQAVAAIFMERQRIDQLNSVLQVLEPLSTRLNDFYSEFSITVAQIQSYDIQPIVNPQALERFTSTYETATETLQQLEGAFEKATSSLVRGLPQSASYTDHSRRLTDAYAIVREVSAQPLV